ncbi:MAG: hypothetical protein JW915_05170 [Chitinispirillaceae bacterium]|nr:hypothetical protein [Chitinispirillaceae bacterium]
MTHNIISAKQKRTHLCFSSLLLLQIFFCAQYDSIYDPKSNLEYSFTINGIDTSSVFSVFQTYTLNLDDSAGYHRYYDFSCIAEKEDVAHITQDGNNTFQIFFYNACTTLIHVNGIRYNGNNDPKQFTVKVVNPYSVAGRDTFAKNELCSLLIKNDRSVNDGIPEKQIHWSAGSFTGKTNADSFFTFQWNETVQDTILEIAADLVYDSIKRYPLGKKRITFKGWAPSIRSVNIDFPSDDALQQKLYQAEPFKVHLKINDPDLNPYQLIVKDKNGMLIDSIHVNPYDSNCTLILPGMRNHGTEEELRIQITDADGYQNSFIRKVTVTEVTPAVFIPDTLEIPFNSMYIVKIDSFVNSSKFHWSLTKNDSDIANAFTTDDHFIIAPLNSIDTFILKVQPESAVNTFGNPKSCIIITKEYNYQTVFKNTGNDTLFIKVNKQDTLYTGLLNNDTIIANSDISYRWTIPSGAASNYIAIKDPLRDSLALFNFKEILPPFRIEVRGICDNVEAAPAQLILKTMWFTPIFSFTGTSFEKTVNIPFFPEYTSKITDPESSPITEVYYKIPQLSTVPSIYDTAAGIRFNTTGTFTLIMWCVDSDGSVSNYDTAEVTTSSDLPYIRLISDKVIAPINRLVTITGDTAYAGKTAIPIDSILLDTNNDNVWDCSIAPGVHNEILIELPGYPEPTLDTITIACKDRSGNISISVKKFIHVYSEIPRINNCIQKDTSTIYTGKQVFFNCSITDPDDSILTLKIFCNDSLFKTTNTGRQDTFSLQFLSAGAYRIALLAQDDSGHVSDTFLLSAPLIIDEGRPVIKNLTIKNRNNIFINDNIQLQISGIDYNGKVIEYQYYFNDTLSEPEITINSFFNDTFTNSGKQIIYVRVMDNDSLFSIFKKDSITVRAGLPVVRSISVDTPTFFAGSTPSFTISMADTNGTIKKLQISWNGDTAALHTFTNEDTLKNSTQRVQYPSGRTDTGTVVIKMRVQDDDGLFSQWKACSLYIDPGVPEISSITIESDPVLYVNDSILLKVTAADVNNSVKSIKVSWKNDGIFEDMELSGNQAQKFYRFERNDTTLTDIKIKVTDATDLPKDSLFPITVLPGRPVIDSISPSEVYIKDTTNFTLIAHDINDTALDSFFINFDTNEHWIKNTSGSFPGIHFDDTSWTGIRQVSVKVLDKDSLTMVKTCTLNVKLGRPIVTQRQNSPEDSIQWVSGSSGRPDTMFFRWTGGMTTMAVEGIDNDTILKYYWTWKKPGLLSNTTDDPLLQRDGLTINDTNWVTVTCKDNDSVRSLPYTFVVFPDGPPEVPEVYAAIVEDSIEIFWNGRDFKDGINTQYKILIKDGAAPTDDDSLTTFTFGTSNLFRDATLDGYQLKYKFKLNANNPKHIYHYQVIARDARGSMVKSLVHNFPY